MRGTIVALICAMAMIPACAAAPKPNEPIVAKPVNSTPAPSNCKRPTLATVKGERPPIRQRQLRRYGNDRYSCAALWVPKLEQGFVPQGLAIDGNTAWISGHAWDEGLHHQSCQLMQIDVRTGKLLKFTPRIKGPVGKLPPVACRHGGAVAVTKHGVWVIETARIWLMDPRRVGKSGQIKRSWRVIKPAMGSVGAIGDGLLIMGGYTGHEPARLDWFRLSDLLRRGAVELRTREMRLPGSRFVTAIRSQSAPSKMQGLQIGQDDSLMIGRSTSVCGQLRLGRLSLAFLPGAEGFDFDRDGDLWVVSETTALNVVERRSKPIVPSLVRFDYSRLVTGARSRCMG